MKISLSFISFVFLIFVACGGSDSSSENTQEKKTDKNFLFEALFENPNDIKDWVIIGGDNDNEFWEYDTSITYNESKGAVSVAYNSFPNSDWLISPAIDLGDDDDRLEFMTRSKSDDFMERMEVLVLTNQQDTNSATSLVQLEEIPDEWTQYEIDLDDYVGKTVYIAFRYNSADQIRIFLDNVRIRIEP